MIAEEKAAVQRNTGSAMDRVIGMEERADGRRRYDSASFLVLIAVDKRAVLTALNSKCDIMVAFHTKWMQSSPKKSPVTEPSLANDNTKSE